DHDAVRLAPPGRSEIACLLPAGVVVRLDLDFGGAVSLAQLPFLRAWTGRRGDCRRPRRATFRSSRGSAGKNSSYDGTLSQRRVVLGAEVLAQDRIDQVGQPLAQAPRDLLEQMRLHLRERAAHQLLRE